MKMYRLLTFIAGLLFLSFSVSVQRDRTSGQFFFIQITDPQFGFLGDQASYEKEKILYRKAVDEVNKLNPAFVVITGDLVHNNSDSEKWAEFKRITAMIKSSVPVYFSPGNHDIGLNPTRESITDFRKSIGNDRFFFKHKKNMFIGFNSSIIKADTPVMEEEQSAWLIEKLRKAGKANNIVLFCHYPFFLKDPDEPETYSNIGIEKRKKYLELFSQHNVTAVFAGHHHDNAYGKYGDIDLITTGAAGHPLGKAPSGMRIVVVRKTSVASRYYGFENIPEAVDFSIEGHE